MNGNNDYEIRQVSLYEVHPQAIVKVLAAIDEFVTYIRLNEPGTSRYEVWQESDNPARFVHIIVFRDEEAGRRHTESAETKKFADILSQQCLEPAKFISYRQIATNAHPSL
ncbi:MAG: putative quinol monooxygenase [Acidobacteriaceae bacterium]